MDKIFLKVNIVGFKCFLLLFKIAIIIGTPIYKYILTPMLWVLWQLAKALPADTDPNPMQDAINKDIDAMAHNTATFIDNHIFKTPELESERWTREWEAEGCPNYKNNTND